MNYLSQQIVFREIPDEISLSYLITGCSLRCPGCHSPDSWKWNLGTALNPAILAKHIDKYQDWITCVLFMGGEWAPLELIDLLQFVKSRGLKTALYTGQTSISENLLRELDYLKVGPYIQELGGLDSPTTNQRLFDLKNNKILNSFFIDSTQNIEGAL